MPYNLELSGPCKRGIQKMCRKNKVLENALKKKINQILDTPYHFKPLKAPLQNKRRVHIMNCFVLIYEVVEETKSVRLLKFSHHDDAY
jgi:YafQ family addiction module toxin component